MHRTNRKAPYLLTPGPVITSPDVKQALSHDLSPMADPVVSITREARRYLLEIAGAGPNRVCVPLQGSATYGVEAALRGLVPAGGRVLVVVNGFYGQRLREVAEAIGRDVVAIELPMLPEGMPGEVETALELDPNITHLALCHCETGTGVINPVEEVAAVARRRGIGVILDAVASFGALDVDMEALSVDALIVSPNKCLEAVPGICFVLLARETLVTSAGSYGSYALDLHDQWCHMEATGFWRCTPPTHVIAAFGAAIGRHKDEGGVSARVARYWRNWSILVHGLRERGFATLLPDGVAAPIVATFHDPPDPRYSFPAFYAGMERRGVVVFPGRLTAAKTFRIGCMGDLDEDDMRFIVHAVDSTITELGVVRRAPPGPHA